MIVQYEGDLNALKAEIAAEAAPPAPKTEQLAREVKQSTSDDDADAETEDATDKDTADERAAASA